MDSHNPYAPSQVTIAPPSLPLSSDYEAIRKAHIKAENTAKTAGALYYIGAVVFMVASLASLLDVFGAREGQALVALVSAMFVLALGLGVGFLAHSLRTLKSWVRIPAIILSCVGLLGFPIGTLIHGLILSAIAGKKGRMIFSPEYKDIIAATPHIRQNTSMGVKVLLGLLLVLLLIIVGGLILGAS